MTGAPPHVSDLIAAARDAAALRGPAPVHLWNPAHCGEIDILIRADGTWLHEGSPIGRPELVRLFSTVLRKDADGHVLVTPGEKLSIRVEDLPFRAVAIEADADGLTFTTDVGDVVRAGTDHPLVVEQDAAGQPRPRLLVRGDLWARVARPVFYELVERAEVEGGDWVIRSDGARFVLGPVEGETA